MGRQELRLTLSYVLWKRPGEVCKTRGFGPSPILRATCRFSFCNQQFRPLPGLGGLCNRETFQGREGKKKVTSPPLSRERTPIAAFSFLPGDSVRLIPAAQTPTGAAAAYGILGTYPRTNQPPPWEERHNSHLVRRYCRAYQPVSDLLSGRCATVVSPTMLHTN